MYNGNARDRDDHLISRFPDGFPGIVNRAHTTGVCHERSYYSYQIRGSFSNYY